MAVLITQNCLKVEGCWATRGGLLVQRGFLGPGREQMLDGGQTADPMLWSQGQPLDEWKPVLSRSPRHGVAYAAQLAILILLNSWIQATNNL